jgi:hypothetical protein
MNPLVSGVLPGKRTARTERMFIRTLLYAVRDTDMQDGLSIALSQNVNEIVLMLHGTHGAPVSVILSGVELARKITAWFSRGIPRLRSG